MSHVSEPAGKYSKVNEAPSREERKSREHTNTDMRNITKSTQMLDLIKSSGCQINPASLEQLLFYNQTDVNFKTMN